MNTVLCNFNQLCVELNKTLPSDSLFVSIASQSKSTKEYSCGQISDLWDNNLVSQYSLFFQQLINLCTCNQKILERVAKQLAVSSQNNTTKLDFGRLALLLTSSVNSLGLFINCCDRLSSTCDDILNTIETNLCINHTIEQFQNQIAYFRQYFCVHANTITKSVEMFSQIDYSTPIIIVNSQFTLSIRQWNEINIYAQRLQLVSLNTKSLIETRFITLHSSTTV